MNDKISGMKRPDIQALPQIADRLTFLYLEKCRLNRKDNAITVTDEAGIVHIPANALSVLMLGPGTTVSHRAIELAGDAGISIVWVGENGIRYYASGRPLTHSSSLLLRQARLVSNVRTHAQVVRRMYLLRFPLEQIDGLTIEQLRGREGSRIRNLYRRLAKEWGVNWKGRDYDPDHFDKGDPVNQALSIGNSCLYGLAVAVTASLGLSPGLGFVHVGHDLSFAYDIADLYKAEISIPAAFECAAKRPEDFAAHVRKKVRDLMRERHILERMVRDIKLLLMEDTNGEEPLQDVLYLWDDRKTERPSGHLYTDDETGDQI